MKPTPQSQIYYVDDPDSQTQTYMDNELEDEPTYSIVEPSYSNIHQTDNDFENCAIPV